MSNSNEKAIVTPAIIHHNNHDYHQENSKKSKNKGPYILGKTLGEGAFAKVKVATHKHIKEKVAIKILNKSRLFEDENDILRIQKEIKILKKLRHKNIIQLYEVLESQKSLYIVMEFCQGGELFDYIVKKKKISETEACHLFQQIINGVEYLHQQNIIHRDLKPENLLLDNHYNIKISDFGLSTFAEPHLLLQTPCGTPSYAPPEMLKGDHYNGTCSDIWSCGIILYAMLCGTLPFNESQEDLICKKIMTHDYYIPGYVSKEARNLLEHLMMINPRERYDLNNIKRHPWFNLTLPRLRPGLIIGEDQFPIDEKILNLVEQYGLDKEKCRQNLENNTFDSLTCVYYLCLKIFIEQGGQSISDVGSDLFEEYIKSQRNMKDRKILSSSDSEIVNNNDEDEEVEVEEAFSHANENTNDDIKKNKQENDENDENEANADDADENITQKKNMQNYRYVEPSSQVNKHHNHHPKQNNYPHQKNKENNRPNVIIPPSHHNNNLSLPSPTNANNNNSNPSFVSTNHLSSNANNSNLSNSTKKISYITSKSKIHNSTTKKLNNINSNTNDQAHQNLVQPSNIKQQQPQSSKSNHKFTTSQGYQHHSGNSTSTNLITVFNTTTAGVNGNVANSSNYSSYPRNKSKQKQLIVLQPQSQPQQYNSATNTINQSQNKSNSKQQGRKISTRITPQMSQSKDKMAYSIDINPKLKNKIKEFSSSVAISSQKELPSYASSNKPILQPKTVNSNLQSFVFNSNGTNTNTNEIKPQKQIISSVQQREQYKKNRNDAKENNYKFHHKSNPCPNELLSLLDKEEDDDDDIFKIGNKERPINVIEQIAKQLVAISFCGNIQLPLSSSTQQAPQQQSFILNSNDTEEKQNSNNIFAQTMAIINSSTSTEMNIPPNSITTPHDHDQEEEDKSFFYSFINIYNKSYKRNNLDSEASYNDETNNKKIVTTNPSILAKINAKRGKGNTKVNSTSNGDNNSNTFNTKHEVIIPTMKKYKNETNNHYNAITNARYKKNPNPHTTNKIREPLHERHIKNNSINNIDNDNKCNCNTRHYNKFLDISTNYDPGLDSRCESSVERSQSIKSDLRNYSISPDGKKLFSSMSQSHQIVNLNTLNSSFSGNKSTSNLKMMNNNTIGIISEDEEYQLSEKKFRNIKQGKKRIHNFEKKVTINLSMNLNDNSNTTNPTTTTMKRKAHEHSP